jgi:hypothetical protein
MSVTKVSSAMQDLTDDYAFSGTVSGAGAPSHRNDIINGGLVVNQENQTAPADDAYTIGDLFLHVGEGTPVMSLETDGPQGTRPWQKMVLDANAQGGLVYFMSNDDVQDYIANGKLSFGIQLKTTAATIANARIGILKWTGTADAVTSDVVGTWASDGTNPTLATSWSYENTPANIGLTTSWARHTVEDVTVDSDTKNIAIFIWTDDGTITASDVIGFSEWQLNPGSTVHAFSQPHFTVVRDSVMYYLERHAYDSVGNEMTGYNGYHSTTTTSQFDFTFNVKKRTNPTTTSSAAATLQISYAQATADGTGIAFNSNGGRNSERVTLTTSAVAAAGDGVTLLRDSSDTAFLQFDSRF